MLTILFRSAAALTLACAVTACGGGDADGEKCLNGVLYGPDGTPVSVPSDKPDVQVIVRC